MDDVSASIERRRQIKAERAEALEIKKRRLANAGSLHEYHHILYGDEPPPLQQTANLGYSSLKGRR